MDLVSLFVASEDERGRVEGDERNDTWCSLKGAVNRSEPGDDVTRKSSVDRSEGVDGCKVDGEGDGVNRG